MLGDQAALSIAPCTIVNIVNKYSPEQARFIYEALNPIKFASHPDQPTLFLLTPVDIPSLEQPEDWKLQCLFTTWGATHADTNAERVRIFKEAASKYAEPWRSAALWLPDDTHIPADGVRYWADPVAWPHWNGKITLGGDAAHPMMPFRAQGLNNALADANKYITSLLAARDGQSLSDAIAQYGDEVLTRGSKEIKLSGAWGPMLHDWNTLVQTPLMKQGYGKPARPQPASIQEPSSESRSTSEPQSSPKIQPRLTETCQSQVQKTLLDIAPSAAPSVKIVAVSLITTLPDSGDPITLEPWLSNIYHIAQSGPNNLPPGWQQGHDNQGQVYFIDHNTRTTSRVDPRDRSISRATHPSMQHPYRPMNSGPSTPPLTPLKEGQIGLPDGTAVGTDILVATLTEAQMNLKRKVEENEQLRAWIEKLQEENRALKTQNAAFGDAPARQRIAVLEHKMRCIVNLASDATVDQDLPSQ